MTGLWPVGFNIGKALSGLIKNKLGFMYNFGLGMLLSLTAMCYVMIFVKDSIKIREARIKREIAEKTGHLEDFNQEEEEREEESDLRRWRRKLRSLFDLTNLKEGFRAVFLRRKHNLRPYILLMIFCFEMEMFINVGEWSSSYLYLRRKLQFTMGDYTRFTTIVGVIGIVAQYITIPILSERLKLHDATIILMDITGCFIQTLIVAFVKAEWMLYLGACIAFLDATSFSMIRCMISKYVRPDEIGKILSVVGAIQSFIPILSSPIFNSLYRATVETLPQTFMLVLAGLFLIDWLALVVINLGVRKITKKIEEEDEDREKDSTELKELFDKSETAKEVTQEEENKGKTAKETEIEKETTSTKM